mmetsp:Transcript_79147/g.223790  ORF Transcript_79147/g.223790 Transcript_79147/m.223790 type:complete len:665 (-) Transcript_79147:81-2075(-)
MMDRHMSSHKLQQLIERQEELNYFANQQQQLNFVTEEHINQLNDVCHGLTQEVADLKNGKLAAEARLVSLEQIVDQQQEQISRLKGASGSLASELSALQLQQGSLAEDHETLCDCLLGADVVRPLQMSERRAALRSQRLLLSVLTERPSGRLLRQLVGDSIARLPAASRRWRAYASAESAAGNQSDDSTCAACSLDESAWSRLGQYEPSPAVLHKWAASRTVNKLLGSCVVETVTGGCQVLRLADVHRLLSELGLTAEELVHKFAKGGGFRHHRTGRCVERTANEILRRFASGPVGGQKVIRFRDIYRLLEITGYTLERFEKVFANCSDPDLGGDGRMPLVGTYRICRSIGSGSKAVCFLAESTADSKKAAVKWPVQDAELRALEDIMARQSLARQSHPGLGLPQLLEIGEYQGQKYVATELLGSSLCKVFQRLEGQTTERKWTLLSVLGRLVVRNLRSLHTCGLVHCDISPENIVLGPAKPSVAHGPTWIAPYFVDFGHAQRFPGGAKLAGDKGSLEWSSIRSALGGEPLPMDDLQALGWVLVNGLFGTLPWVRWLQWAYKDWESRWTREQVVRQVQRAKSRLLESGWVAAGWPRGAKVPEELDLFLHACWCKDGETEGRGAMRAPDYSALLLLLGGSPELSEGDAEEQDLRLLTQRMAPLMP